MTSRSDYLKRYVERRWLFEAIWFSCSLQLDKLLQASFNSSFPKIRCPVRIAQCLPDCSNTSNMPSARFRFSLTWLAHLSGQDSCSLRSFWRSAGTKFGFGSPSCASDFSCSMCKNMQLFCLARMWRSNASPGPYQVLRCLYTGMTGWTIRW